MPNIHNLNGSIQVNDWELLAQVAHRFGWTIHWEESRPYRFTKGQMLIIPFTDEYGGFNYANYRIDMHMVESHMHINETIQALTHLGK